MFDSLAAHGICALCCPTTSDMLRAVIHKVHEIAAEVIRQTGRDKPADAALREVLKQIKDESPAISVVIFSHFPEDQYAVRAHKAGVVFTLVALGVPFRENIQYYWHR